MGIRSRTQQWPLTGLMFPPRCSKEHGMAENKITDHDAEGVSSDPEAQARREFLKKIGAASAAVPAAALLLAVNAKSAQAQEAPYGGGGSGSGSACIIT